MMRRALVVDDDRMMVRTLSDVLRIKGWDVTPAYSGSTAVEAASTGSFDVVLMDIKMPGMDGVAAFKQMKAARPDLRVILMTAYAANELIEEAQREGVVRVLPKPVDVGSLLSLLSASAADHRPVLIVDHDSTFLKSLSDVLGMRGFETIVATSLDDAVHHMAQRKPTAVLLHVQLDTPSGREAVLAVHQVSPAIALILYSGHAEAADEIGRSIPRDWVHAYLRKPFAVDQVTGILDAIQHKR